MKVWAATERGRGQRLVELRLLHGPEWFRLLIRPLAEISNTRFRLPPGPLAVADISNREGSLEVRQLVQKGRIGNVNSCTSVPLPNYVIGDALNVYSIARLAVGESA